MIQSVHQSLADDGDRVSLSQLCRWFDMPRRTPYYQPIKTPPKVNEAMVTRIKAFIEKYPEAEYRTVAWMLNYNKNTVQRIFQLKGWQVNKKSRGFRPRVKTSPSAVPEPDTHWSTYLARVWCSKDRWFTLAVVMDCGSRELVGYHLICINFLMYIIIFGNYVKIAYKRI